MATINDKFLDSFRALDTELKTNGSTVLDFENTLEGIEQEQMKVCRIMRNYMAHNDTIFLTASNEQIKFLDSKVLELRKAAHTVKDEMKRIKEIKSTEPIKNVIAALAKYDIVPVVDKTNIYLVDKNILIKQLANGNKKIIIPAKLPKYKYVDKLTRIDHLRNGVYIVTDDGQSTGKYLGIFINNIDYLIL